MHPAGEDPARLLTEAGQWTEPWGSAEDGNQCEKCNGSGRVRHECWSCLLIGPRSCCPVCAGELRWDADCPVCRGTGQIDGAPRHGVSTFPTLEGLYHYMIASGAELDRCVVVELEADIADDVDFDADQGAMLVIPTAVHKCERVDPILARRVEREAEQAAR